MSAKKAFRIQIEHSLSAAQAETLLDLVSTLVAAEVAHSWKGGGDPCDIPVIEAELALARAKLDAFVTRLVAKNGG